jgi:hypothetical protein
MPTDPLQVKELRDFGGMFSDKSPHDIQDGGSIEQINVAQVRPNTLHNRGGMREVVWLDAGPPHEFSSHTLGEFSTTEFR